MIREDKLKLEHEMRLRAESDRMSIVKLEEDNSRARRELEDKDVYLARLREELDALRTQNDHKTVEISKFTSELNTKADVGANLRADYEDLNRTLAQDEDMN